METKHEKLFPDDAERSDQGSEQVVRRGPPNRMNDLSYRDWMKFQKSFFRTGDLTDLAKEHIQFFTKAVWDDQTVSVTLLAADADAGNLSGRTIHQIQAPETIEDAIDIVSGRDALDYVFIDLRAAICDESALEAFARDGAECFFQALRAGLKPGRYCTLLVDSPEPAEGGFPLAWAIGMLGRSHLKLRDEKVGIADNRGNLLYCLNFQAADDSREARWLNPSEIQQAIDGTGVESWVIPKPPPRKPHEVLHPAKYPETLVEGFIERFTKRGDRVFDPMVGTGSTLVAALRKGRHSAGTDLSAEFVEISKRRVRDESSPNLFDSIALRADVFEADAAKLFLLDQLKESSFDYAITSPPYWSMLSNKGSENQEKRRSQGLKIVYSNDDRDLGNVSNYDEFINLLESVYLQVALLLKPGAHLTVVVKNVKREHTLFPLAWDLVARLAKPGSPFAYSGYSLWCQDDVSVKPFAVGIHWVSNILHTYCLHFKRT